jgi:sarcosine oxidase gamma subunit
MAGLRQSLKAKYVQEMAEKKTERASLRIEIQNITKAIKKIAKKKQRLMKSAASLSEADLVALLRQIPAQNDGADGQHVPGSSSSSSSSVTGGAPDQHVPIPVSSVSDGADDQHVPGSSSSSASGGAP